MHREALSQQAPALIRRECRLYVRARIAAYMCQPTTCTGGKADSCQILAHSMEGKAPAHDVGGRVRQYLEGHGAVIEAVAVQDLYCAHDCRP